MNVVPLKTVADLSVSNVDKKSVGDEVPVRLCNYTDVYYNDSISADLAFMSATATPQQIAKFSLRSGDTLFTKDSETAADIAIAAFVPEDLPGVVCGYHLAMARPKTVDPKFLYWSMLSSAVREQMTLAATGVTRFGIRQDLMGQVTLAVPSRLAQRAIADFLDAETARIDLIVSKRKTHLAMLRARQGLSFQRAIERLGARLPTDLEGWVDVSLPAGWQVARLGPLLEQLTNGYVGPTRDILVEDGVRYIQGLHIKSGRIDFARRPYFVRREWFEDRPRIALKRNDVLIVQTGDVGQCAVVPEGFGEASCHALLIARPNSKRIRSRYLGCYLQSEFGRAQLLRLATGALHPHLEFGIRSARVLLPPLEAQDEICDEVESSIRSAEELVAAIGKQCELFQERRQALITAAVIGQLDLARGIAEEAS